MIISREAKKTTDKVQHSLMEKNPLKLGIESFLSLVKDSCKTASIMFNDERLCFSPKIKNIRMSILATSI